jgi:hypothetical protein
MSAAAGKTAAPLVIRTTNKRFMIASFIVA